MSTQNTPKVRTALVTAAVLLGAALLAVMVVRLTPAAGDTGAEPTSPARVEAIEGSELSRITVTQKAAQRLDIQARAAATEAVSGKQRLVVPYSSILYDAKGGTWVYTSPEPLVFVRAPITVDFIRGDRVVLKNGPAPGTAVVIVGATELFGTEFGVGH
jgi:hypothetical protein